LLKEPQNYIEEVTQWALSCDSVQALALAGSQARGEARPDSDIDFIIFCDDKSVLLEDLSWIEQFGVVANHTNEQ
jgi:predicted nucleotidyltransferase